MQRIISALASDAETASICWPLPMTVALPGPAISFRTSSAMVDVVLLISAQGAADAVEQEAFGLVHGVGGKLVEGQAGGPLRHGCGDGWLGRRFGGRWRGRGGHRFFSYFARFLNGKNAMKSAWCTM